MMLESTAEQHACKASPYRPDNPRKFMSCIKKEMTLLQTSLPQGILVRGYEDRMVCTSDVKFLNKAPSCRLIQDEV